jgi:hypothetical protein
VGGGGASWGGDVDGVKIGASGCDVVGVSGGDVGGASGGDVGGVSSCFYPRTIVHSRECPQGSC